MKQKSLSLLSLLLKYVTRIHVPTANVREVPPRASYCVQHTAQGYRSTVQHAFNDTRRFFVALEKFSPAGFEEMEQRVRAVDRATVAAVSALQ